MVLVQILADRIRTALDASTDRLPIGDSIAPWRTSLGELRVTQMRDGRFIWHRIAASDTAPPRSQQLLESALASARDAGEVLLWDERNGGDSIVYELSFLRPTVNKGGEQQPLKAELALAVFSMLVPWEAEVAPMPGNRAPTYPETARSAGMNAVVVTQFVVDTTGRVLRQTFKDTWPENQPRLTGELRMHYNSFVSSVRHALESMRFYPAVIGGCKVKQLVRQPFYFTLK
jgi:hypothetical protein